MIKPQAWLCAAVRMARCTVRRALNKPAAAAVLAAAAAFGGLVAAAPADMTRGLNWLQAQVQPDGRVGASPAAADLQARCETATTLQRLVGNNGQVAALVAALQAQADANAPSESLACVQELRQKLGEVILAFELEQRRPAGQGYAAYPGSTQANPLDTGWALAAQLQNLVAQDRDSVLQWLQGAQRSDGSFATQGVSDLYSTAIVLRSLKAAASGTPLAAQIAAKAAQYILSRRAGGNWQDDVVSTAVAFEAVQPYTGSDTAIAPAVESYLLARQQADGAWGSDPFVTAVALRALSLAGQPPLDPTLAGLKVRFVDARNGIGVPGVVFKGGQLNALSDAGGNVEVRGLTVGGYQLQASLAGYATVNFSISLQAGQVLDLGMVQMVAPSTSGLAVVSGLVRDQQTNLPIVGALVAVQGQSASATTAADGRYLVSNVAPGALTVSASAAGYAASSLQATAQAGQVLNFSPSLVPSGTSTAGICKIQGLITDGNTRQALADVQVVLSGANNVSTSTDAAGRFALNGLATGQTVIRATKSGYDTVQSTARLACSGAMATVLDFSPRLYPGGQTPPGDNAASLAGVVVDAATNQALAGAVIVALPEGGAPQTVQTQASGQFRISGLDRAQVQLQVSIPDYTGVTMQYALSPLETLDIGQIRLRRPKVEQLLADLAVLSVMRDAARTDPQSLTIAGTAVVQVANLGNAESPANTSLLVFSDNNGNGQYDAALDSVLGQAVLAQSLPPGKTATVAVSVAGRMQFRDAPVHAFIDPEGHVAELRRDNNLLSSAALAVSAPVVSATFAMQQKWQWGGSPPAQYPDFTQVMAVPTVGKLIDTNGDGRIGDGDVPIICFPAFAGRNYDREGVIRMIRGDTGELVRSIRDPAVLSGVTSVALADLDGDGVPEIVAATTDQRVIAFHADGSKLWTSQNVPGRYAPEAAITVADLTGTGKPAVIFEGYVFDGLTGAFLWKTIDGAGGSSYTGAIGLATSVGIAADLRGIGQQDVIFGATVYAADGTLRWRQHDGYAAVADLDKDGRPELVVTYARSLYAYTADGVLLWRVLINTNQAGGPPVIADFDGDGVPDIGVSGAYAYAVYRADGSLMWQKSVYDGSAITGSTVFDFYNDGRPKVMYADETALHVYDGATGADLVNLPNSNGTLLEYPLVADIDGDGRADLLVTANDEGGHISPPGVRAFTSDSWVGARAVWNQHAYSIGNINDDLTLPRRPEQSWKTHNTYRLNKRTDGDPRAVPDATVGYARVQDGGAQGSTVTWRVGNTGSYKASAGTPLAFYAVNAQGSASLLGTRTLGQSLEPGQWMDVAQQVPSLAASVTLTVVIDDNGAGRTVTVDFDRSNNAHSIDLRAIARNVAVGVATDKGGYTEADQAIFTAPVTNAGSFAQQVQVRFSVLDGVDQVVQVLALPAQASVAAGASVPVQALWPAAGVLAGSYRVLAELVTAQGVVYGQATASFTVSASQQQANSARVSADRASYTAAQLVQLTSRVANLTANTVQDGLAARTSVQTAGGQGVYERSETIAQLAPGAQRQYGYSLAASGLAAGAYQVRLQLLAGASVLAQSTAAFSVVGSDQSGIGIAGQLQANPGVAAIGQPVALSLAAVNNGNAVLANVPLTVRVFDPATAVVAASYSAIVSSWPVGQTQSLAFSWTAQGLDGGQMLAAATAQVGGREVPIGQAVIGLLGAPRIEPEPAQLILGPIEAGREASQSVVLRSVGSTAAGSLTLALGGADASRFVLTAGGCGQTTTLAVGATCTVSVSYRPQEAGVHTGELRVGYVGQNTAQVAGSATVALSGQARPVAFTGAVQAAPNPLEGGQAVALGYSVSNPAAVSATGSFSLAVHSQAGAALASWPFQAAVGPAGSYAGNQNWVTPEAAQTLTAVLSQQQATASAVLATTSFTVIDAQVPIGASTTFVAQARVLALISCTPGGAGQGQQACEQQRMQAVGAYLTQLGIPNKVVTSEQAFVQELRCGTYNTYWISGGAFKLSSDTIAEVQQAVWRGESLLVEGVQDGQSQQLHPTAGVLQQSGSAGVNVKATVEDGAIYPPQRIATLGEAPAFTLTSGVGQALFDRLPGTPPATAAIVTNQWGAGRSVLFAFDLAGMVVADAGFANSQLQALVTTTAGHLANGSATLTVRDMAGWSVQLTNPGNRSATLQVTASLPAAITYTGAAPVPASVGASSVGWSVTLAPGASRAIVLRGQVLQEAGSPSIAVAVAAVSASGQVGTAQTLQLQLQVQVLTGQQLLAAPVPAIQALPAGNDVDRNERDKIVVMANHALSLHGQGQYAQAIGKWLDVANALAYIGWTDATAARSAVAMALEAEEDTLCQQCQATGGCQ